MALNSSCTINSASSFTFIDFLCKKLKVTYLLVFDKNFLSETLILLV